MIIATMFFIYCVALVLYVTIAAGFGVCTYALLSYNSPSGRRFALVPALFTVLFTVATVLALISGPPDTIVPPWRLAIGIGIYTVMDMIVWYLALYFLGKVK